MTRRSEIEYPQYLQSVIHRQNYIENTTKVKDKFNLTDPQIKKLLEDGHTFTEILEGHFTGTNRFIPKDIILQDTKDYLLFNY